MHSDTVREQVRDGCSRDRLYPFYDGRLTSRRIGTLNGFAAELQGQNSNTRLSYDDRCSLSVIASIASSNSSETPVSSCRGQHLRIFDDPRTGHGPVADTRG